MPESDEIRRAVDAALRDAGFISRGRGESPELYQRLGELRGEVRSLHDKIDGFDRRLGETPEHVRTLMEWRSEQRDEEKRWKQWRWTLLGGVILALAQGAWSWARDLMGGGAGQ